MNNTTLIAKQKRERELKRMRDWHATHPRAPLTPEAKRNVRDLNRQFAADKGDYQRPPLEKDCPPRPPACDCCGAPCDPDRLHLDHDHDLVGSFLGWCCGICNRLGENIERLQARIDYLKDRGF